MITGSLTENLVYKDDKPAITVILKTATSKEVRVVMKRKQVMKEHKAPFSIVVEIFEGVIEFGINGNKRLLKKGDLIALDAHILHDLMCIEDAIIRLSISNQDAASRVASVI